MTLTDSGVKIRYRPGEGQGRGSNLRERCSDIGSEEREQGGDSFQAGNLES